MKKIHCAKSVTEKHLSDTNGPPYFWYRIKVVHYRLKVFIVVKVTSPLVKPLFSFGVVS